MKTKAFTLIELLVVVAIIGILAAVGVVAYNGYTAAAKKVSCLKQHKELVNLWNSRIKWCEMGNASWTFQSIGYQYNLYPYKMTCNKSMFEYETAFQSYCHTNYKNIHTGANYPCSRIGLKRFPNKVETQHLGMMYIAQTDSNDYTSKTTEVAACCELGKPPTYLDLVMD